MALSFMETSTVDDKKTEPCPLLQRGIRNALENCVRLREGERVVIITDPETAFVAQEVERQAKTISGERVRTFYMDIFGERNGAVRALPHFPFFDGALAFPDEIKDALSTADVSFYAATCKPGELASFRRPMIDAVEANPKLRHAHMPGVTPDLIRYGMAVDYGVVQRVTQKVKERVEQAKKIEVTTPAGTSIVAEFFKEYAWIPSDGLILPGKWKNLPSGETYTCPQNVNGVIVVDGILGDHFDKKYGTLEETPVALRVVDGRVVDVSCANTALEQEFKKYMQTDENANRIGEFGIGTNIGLERVVGNLLQDEKFPGVHLAVGHPYPKETGAQWDSNVHCDGVLLKTTIIADGEVIMRDGKFADKYTR